MRKFYEKFSNEKCEIFMRKLDVAPYFHSPTYCTNKYSTKTMQLRPKIVMYKTENHRLKSTGQK